MAKQSKLISDLIKHGTNHKRHGVIMDLRLVQKIKLIASYEDVTEKDLYYGMMKKFVEGWEGKHPNFEFPEYLVETATARR